MFPRYFFFATSVAAGEFSFGAGAEYTEGEYGTGSDNTALYVPFTLGYSADVYSWILTVPYLRVTGTGEVVYGRTGARVPKQGSTTTNGSGSGGTGSGSTTTVAVENTSTVGASVSQQGPTTTNGSGSGGAGSGSTTTVAEESTETGIGDVTLSVTYYLSQGEEEGPGLAMTAKIKFATADENRNLGTGENDYSLRIEAEMGSVSAYLGYLIIGDTATTDYNDIFFCAIGAGRPVGSWNIGGEYYAEQEVLEDVDPVSKVTLFAGRELGKDKWLGFYLIKGFTDSIADWGAGVNVTHYF